MNIFTEFANGIVNTQFFQSYGLLVLYLFPIFTISVIPIPIEIPLAALVYAKFNLLILLTVTWAAMMTGNMVLYYLAAMGKVIIKRATIFEEIEESHFLHRNRWVMFSTMPAVFIIGDALMLYAVSQHMKPQSFVLPLLIGTFIRSVIALLIVLGILALPQYL